MHRALEPKRHSAIMIQLCQPAPGHTTHQNINMQMSAQHMQCTSMNMHYACHRICIHTLVLYRSRAHLRRQWHDNFLQREFRGTCPGIFNWFFLSVITPDIYTLRLEKMAHFTLPQIVTLIMLNFNAQHGQIFSNETWEKSVNVYSCHGQ